MEKLWQAWKKAFDTWEAATANRLDGVVKSPLLLEPAGAMLSAMMRMKKQSDDALAQWWAAAGLPTRREQERMMHTINLLQSRLIDLEERLASSPRGEGASR